MSKFLYPIYKLKTKSYIKWWLYHKKAGGSGVLSEILQGFSFNLENTLNRKFKLFDVEGNSEQETTTGKNLLPNNATTQTYFGITITKKDDGTLILNGTATDIIQLNLLNNKRNNTMLPEADKKYSLESGIYKLSGCTNGSSSTYKLDVWVDGVEGSKATCFNQEVQFTLDEEKIISYLRLVVYSGATLNNVVIKPMVRLASVTDDTYEPYTGGIASPNPNYEQPIKSAGDNGSINEKIKNADGTEEQDYSIFVQKPMMDDDHFDRKNNKEVHTWIKYVLDGSDNENWSIRNNKFFINDNVNYNLWEKSISPNGKSNIGVISYSVLDNHTGYGLALAYGLRLNLENIDASNGGTIEQLRAYLAEHPITIYVKLKDSAYEKLPCTEEQIEQLENLPSTYKDFTIIQSQDETPAHLKIQYYKEG